MDIHFGEPEEIPLPKEDVRVRSVEARPYADGRRVELQVELTPFLDRPNVDVDVLDTEGREVATLSIIEPMHHRFGVTLHLREPEPHGRYTARLVVHYPDTDLRDRAEAEFHIPSQPAPRPQP